MQVTTVGLDLAKNVFQVHGITDNGEVIFNRTLRRAQLLAFFERLDPCLVGIEACGTCHHWARELIRLGHDVKLIPPIYVKPYVKRGKSDAADAVCRDQDARSASNSGTAPDTGPCGSTTDAND